MGDILEILIAQQRADLDAAIQELGDAITHEALKERLSRVNFECPYCSCPDTHYEYFNNKQRGKGFQPRYKCSKCGKQWTIGGRINRPKVHPAHKLEPHVHFPCSKCGSSETRFDYNNNGNARQPCYFCKTCKSKFRPFSKPRRAAPPTTTALAAANAPANTTEEKVPLPFDLNLEPSGVEDRSVVCLNNKQDSLIE